MQDRVAEILHERASLESGAAVGIALSVILHAAMTAVALYAAWHQKPPRTATIVNIRFAQMPPEMTSAASQPPAPAAPPTLKEPQPVVEPTKPPAEKPVEKTVPLSPFGKSTKKGSETPPAPAPQPAPATTGAATAVPVGGAGVTGLEGGDFPYTLYIERMKAIIGGHWFRPQVTAGTTTTVYFVIDRDGAIRDARTELVSGNGTFDRAALRAVLEASPLPPLPFGYNGTYLGVHLTFK